MYVLVLVLVLDSRVLLFVLEGYVIVLILLLVTCVLETSLFSCFGTIPHWGLTGVAVVASVFVPTVDGGPDLPEEGAISGYCPAHSRALAGLLQCSLKKDYSIINSGTICDAAFTQNYLTIC